MALLREMLLADIGAMRRFLLMVPVVRKEKGKGYALLDNALGCMEGILSDG